MRIRLSTTVFLLLATLALPAAARADCQPVESVEAALEAAEVAFVGTVLRTAPGEGAVFRVEEVWAGQLASTIEVGGLNGRRRRVVRPNQEVPAVPPIPAGFAEDDRVWEVGQRYLVIPYLVEGSLVDHICSGTAAWSNELAALRPPTATEAEPEPVPTASPPWPVLIAGALMLVLTIAGWLAFRRTDTAR
jgi:hypothetical protein